jgi:hypothetical protein
MVIAKIAKIQDKYRVIINKGIKHGIKKGMKFYVYEEGEDVFDPDTNEFIEKEEIVKAYMKVLHVQESISILESDETEKITIQPPLSFFGSSINLSGETREVMKSLNVGTDNFNEQNNDIRKDNFNERNNDIREDNIRKDNLNKQNEKIDVVKYENRIIRKGDLVKQLTN